MHVYGRCELFPVCGKCCQINGGHLLTCPEVNLPRQWPALSLDQKYGPSSG